jgi:hypothetical protein
LNFLLLTLILVGFVAPDTIPPLAKMRSLAEAEAQGYVGPGPCIYEVGMQHDTVVVGWTEPWDTPNGPMCPDYDGASTFEHNRLQHSAFVPDCPALWQVTSWANIPAPMVVQDLMHPICNKKEADNE